MRLALSMGAFCGFIRRLAGHSGRSRVMGLSLSITGAAAAEENYDEFAFAAYGEIV